MMRASHPNAERRLTRRDVARSLLASGCASALHWAMMDVKHHFALLPAFDPYRDLQEALSAALRLTPDSPAAVLLPYVNAALLWGLLYAPVQNLLPGLSWRGKGSVLALAIWLAMGLVFLPLLGHRIFALDLGLGARPALLMLAMVFVYALLASFIYDRLTRGAGGRGPRDW